MAGLRRSAGGSAGLSARAVAACSALTLLQSSRATSGAASGGQCGQSWCAWLSAAGAGPSTASPITHGGAISVIQASASSARVDPVDRPRAALLRAPWLTAACLPFTDGPSLDEV